MTKMVLKLVTIVMAMIVSGYTSPSTAQDMMQFSEVNRFGRGVADELSWDSTGDQLAVVSSIGAWVYNDRLELEFMIEASTGESTWRPGDNLLTFVDEGENNAKLGIWQTGNNQFDTQNLSWDSAPLDLRWSPDGTLLASSTSDISIFDTSGNQLYKFEDPEKIPALINNIIWSPDSQLVLGLAPSGIFQVWEIDTQRNVTIQNTTNIPGDMALDASWSPDGTQIAIATFEDGLWIWDTGTWNLSKVIDFDIGGVTHVAWYSDDEVIVGNLNGEVKRLNVTSEEETILVKHSSFIKSLSVAPTKDLIASLGDDQQIIITNSDTGDILATSKEHLRGITSLQWSGDNTQIVVGMTDHKMEVPQHGFTQVWDTVSEQIHWQNPQMNNISQVEWYSEDELSIAGLDGKVNLWDISDNSQSEVASLVSEPVYLMDWNSENTFMATISYPTGEFSLFNFATQEISEIISDREYFLSWHPQEDMFLRVGREQIEIWDLASMSITKTFQTSALTTIGVWSPDGDKIASVDSSGTLTIWDVESEEKTVIVTLNLPDFVLNSIWSGNSPLAWNSDGSLIALSYLSRQITLIDTGSGNIIQQLAGHSDQVTALDWRSDEDILASGSLDGTIRLWATE